MCLGVVYEVSEEISHSIIYLNIEISTLCHQSERYSSLVDENVLWNQAEQVCPMLDLSRTEAVDHILSSIHNKPYSIPPGWMGEQTTHKHKKLSKEERRK